MLIARHWARAEATAETPAGKRIPVVSWGGSAVGPDDARAKAQRTVERIVARIRAGQGFPERYAYGDRPLREEILVEMRGGDGELRAVVTRNAYGARVLNAANALFVDVDLPRRSRLATLLRRLGHALVPGRIAAPRQPEEEPLRRLGEWIAAHPGWSVRAYRTRSGLRYLATHAAFQPGGRDAEAAMEALGCDPRYVRLCRVQESFRARLSPKPWRCGVAKPPARFPYDGEAEEREIRAWEGRYESAAGGWATCRLLAAFGSGEVHPDLAPLVEMHDAETRVGSDLPLA